MVSEPWDKALSQPHHGVAVRLRASRLASLWLRVFISKMRTLVYMVSKGPSYSKIPGFSTKLHGLEVSPSSGPVTLTLLIGPCGSDLNASETGNGAGL